MTFRIHNRVYDEEAWCYSYPKNRDGATGDVPATWTPHFTRFDNYQQDHRL